MGTARSVLVASLTIVLFSIITSQSRAIEDSYDIGAGGDLDWGPISGSFLIDSPTPVSSPVNMFDSFGSASGSVSASDGIVKGSLSGSFNAAALQTRRFNPKIIAQHSGALIFGGPTPTIETQLNMHMDGVLSVEESSLGPNPFRNAAGFVQFRLTVNGVASTLIATAHDDDNNGKFAQIDVNDFTGLQSVEIGSTVAFGDNGKTPTLTVPMGVEVPVELFMQLSFNHFTNGFGGSSTFEGDFDNTFSFARGRPVFDLPPGYTVNGMGIVDNRYVIPEPNCVMLLLMAAAAFSARRRRS